MSHSIFKEQISRKPDYYPWAQDIIRSMWEGHWTDREFTFSSDKRDFYTRVSDQERETIVRSLSAIAQLELPVKNFWLNLGRNLPHPSLIDLGCVLASIEVIHANSYSRLIDELGMEDVFLKNLELEWMKGRINYLRKYTHKYYKDNKKQFIYSLILFTLFVENISLFSQFYVINWFGRKNLFKDTNQQVAYTAREEVIHAKAGILIIKEIQKENPEYFDNDLKEKIIHETQEAYKAECNIIDWIVNGLETEFLSSSLLKEFIKKRMNDSLVEIGYPKIFDIDNKLIEKTEWFDEIVLGNTSSDFFFGRPTEYSKSNQSFNEEDLFN